MKLSKEQMELYNFIDKLLIKEWDPIGVYGVPEARDEYHGYLPVVFGKAIKNETEKEIAEYLEKIETENMGLQSSGVNNLNIAKKITSKKQLIVGD